MREYGAYRRGNSDNVPLDLEKHNASVDYWLTFNIQIAIENASYHFIEIQATLKDRSNNTEKISE